MHSRQRFLSSRLPLSFFLLWFQRIPYFLCFQDIPSLSLLLPHLTSILDSMSRGCNTICQRLSWRHSNKEQEDVFERRESEWVKAIRLGFERHERHTSSTRIPLLWSPSDGDINSSLSLSLGPDCERLRQTLNLPTHSFQNAFVF